MARSALRPVVWQLRGLAVATEFHAASDAELLARFAQGHDEAAFAALVGRHGRLVWSVCRQVAAGEADAEDAFQASFLVLARKAGGIHTGQTLGSWLYRVAYRVAMKTRRDAARRRKHEARAGRTPPPPAPCGLAWAELQAALQEELDRLPERYRAPFVLCCLEGRSRSDVARELGCKEGTVGSRLDRARQRLRDRLARRGIALAALLAAQALAGADVAAGQLEAAARAGALFAAGRAAAAGRVSARVLTLADGALRSLALARVTLVLPAVILAGAVALLTGLAVGTSSAGGEGGPRPPQPAASTPLARARPSWRLWPVDVQPRANQKLTDNFGSGRAGNNLAGLPTGEQSFAGVRFRVEDGMLQLGSKYQKEPKPDRIEGIPVGVRFARLHALHGTGYGAGSVAGAAPAEDDPLFVPDGTRIAEFRLHYEDGGTAVLPVVYGQDVRDWWSTPRSQGVSRGAVAWSGANDLAKQFGAGVRLYRSTWANPRPRARVVRLDYTKVNDTPAAPFCLALTLERP